MADRVRAEPAGVFSARGRSAKPRFDVVGFGALNLDHLYQVPQLIRDGGVEVVSSTAQPGGSSANTVYGLAKLGLRCGFVGIVGDDDAGAAILDSFGEVGVDTNGILVKPGISTGQTICITAGEGQKAIYIMPGANSLLDSDDIDLAYLSDTRHVHMSSFVGESPFSQQLRAVEKLRPQIRVSLALDDVYARHRLDAMTALLRRCAVLFANAEELRELTGQELHSAAAACLNIGCEVVVATFGSGEEQDERLAVSDPQETIASVILTRRTAGRVHETVEYTVPALRTHHEPVVDTVGAGDAFAAGFLFGLLSKRVGLAKCGAMGHTTAEFSLMQLGGRKGLPTKEELLARFNEAFRPFFGRQRRSRPVQGAVQAE